MADQNDKLSSSNDATNADNELSRRTMIKLTVGAAMAAPFVDLVALKGRAAQAGAAPALKWLTPAEFAIVDELAEMIIPADAQSGGARAAGVVPYLDGRMAETQEPGEQDQQRAAIKAFDDAARKANGKGFVESSPEERLAFVTALAKNEFNPTTPEEKFFREFKTTVAYVYYSSDIGIHKDIGYLGNTYLDEFSGYDVSTEDKA